MKEKTVRLVWLRPGGRATTILGSEQVVTAFYDEKNDLVGLIVESEPFERLNT